MTWKSLLRSVLINLVVSLGGSVVVLALIGYLLAGSEGLQNGAIWGLILGLIAFPLSSMAVLYKFWHEQAKEIGSSDTWGNPWGK